MRRPAPVLASSSLAAMLFLGVLPLRAQIGSAGSLEARDEGSGSLRIRVFFATNRKPLDVARPGTVFGGKRGEPSFGTCEVRFQRIPAMEGLAKKVPFWVPTESSEQRIRVQVDQEEFWNRLIRAAGETSTRNVVVFIHGYSYGFERSCDRAAAAQRALEGEATVLLFTWPSNGVPTDYASDTADLERSVPFLMEVLDGLHDRVGAQNVQVMAHSLGSKGVVEALLGFREQGVDQLLLRRLVFLAPDLDTEEFLDILPGIRPLAGGITLYASDNDTPLKFSRQVNGSSRLGQAGEFLTVAEGMETVDVTPAGRQQILGHEYFYYHPLVGDDLVELLATGRSAAERSVPRSRSREGLTYWEIVAEEEH